MHEDGPGTAIAPAPEREATTQREPAWLRCRVCGRRIARADDGASFDGGQHHRFINPSGIAFRIALFRDAPGCRHDDVATEYFSWFPGYTWRIALCNGCASHLGWAFECIGEPGIGEPSAFHGLIEDRLSGS